MHLDASGCWLCLVVGDGMAVFVEGRICIGQLLIIHVLKHAFFKGCLKLMHFWMRVLECGFVYIGIGSEWNG